MPDFRKLRIGGESMINTSLLNDYINNSGLSIKNIADCLNLSENEFIHKKDVIKDFEVSEIFTLCDILHIVKHQEKVFFMEV